MKPQQEADILCITACSSWSHPDGSWVKIQTMDFESSWVDIPTCPVLMSWTSLRLDLDGEECFNSMQIKVTKGD
jgi:hypothetical protein